ncbi:docking protein 1 isoform X1 [Syngnathus scovelli]|uniref:docking protein 1 isoform X1 n=2 Tax=Syngnathus scovelli TaxID=161590 RepID=UPI0021100262|nr:docking protein 1 [Syngnathus scovelli]
MDSPTKIGQVYLQPRKAGKKWKPVLLSLVPPSNNGVGRLEIQFIAGGGGAREHIGGLKRHQQLQESKIKVVRLSELISVQRLPPNAEACPMENMSAFCVESQDRTMVFATQKDDCVDWVEKLCQGTFQRSTGSDTNELRMEENQIYATTNDEFSVVVQRTDAAIRCGLQGSYWLQVGQKTLLLKDTQKVNIVRQWPYELLRRYGKDKLALTIEAGRRCDSGPGTFTFETQHSEKIFNLIQSTIKKKTLAVTSSNLHQEEDKGLVAKKQVHSPLPEIPEMTSAASIRENANLQIDTSPGTEDNMVCQDCSAHLSENQLQPPPITLMPLPMVPIFDKPSRDLHGCQPEAEYANPADCIKNLPKPQATMSHVYVDPASVLPLHPPTSKETINPGSKSFIPHPCSITSHPDSVYSEVYDKVNVGKNEQNASSSEQHFKHLTEEEPIYAVPVRKEDEVSDKDETKPDPFTHLYAQVNKTPSSSSPSSTPPPSSSSSLVSSIAAAKISDNPLDDVIYENLGII